MELKACEPWFLMKKASLLQKVKLKLSLIFLFRKDGQSSMQIIFGTPLEAIAAVSVTTQRATVVPMGKDHQPLRPAISWLDQRQVETKPQLGKIESALMSLIRAKPLVDLMHAQAEANWIEQNEPEIWKQIHKL